DLSMPWFKIRKQNKEKESQEPPATEKTGAPEPPLQSAEATPTLPPHMQRLVDERSKVRPRRQASVEERRASYDRKRLAIQYDIEQGYLATEPENPWTHRIELLTEALGTIEEDLKAESEVPPAPFYPLPPTPISDITIERDRGIAVSFTIDGHRFAFAETLDWAERGHRVSQPEFRATVGDVEKLIPAEKPPELREPLEQHLTDSLAVFATDLRDRALDNEPMPTSATLADLAGPCKICGGWADWRGRCDACTNRKAREQSLRLEQTRLLRERANEAEERHRMAERLPIARRRMADLEAEIAAFERSLREET
ncbi:MAG TPA: hypothetical protein VGR29_02175, partial [Thermomicrobiales bacterium]|nr:hypothetical protein [Thermomicrobiales bacterium]